MEREEETEEEGRYKVQGEVNIRLASQEALNVIMDDTIELYLTWLR